MQLQTVCPHDLQDSKLEAVLAMILGFLLEDQILTTSLDCGRNPLKVESVYIIKFEMYQSVK